MPASSTTRSRTSSSPPWAASANSNILLNAEKTVGQGFELDFQAYLTDTLLFTLGSSYNDTEIKDDDLAVAGCAACDVTDAPEVDPVDRPADGTLLHRRQLAAAGAGVDRTT